MQVDKNTHGRNLKERGKNTEKQNYKFKCLVKHFVYISHFDQSVDRLLPCL